MKKVARALNSDGVPVEDETDVTSYFVDEKNQQPIDKEDITKWEKYIHVVHLADASNN